MMLAILAEAALRSFLLGSVVWIVLTLFRVQNLHVHMTSWVMVLAASLSMPLLMHWTTVTVTVPSLPLSAPESFWIAEDFPSESLQLSQPSASSVPPPGGRHAEVNWWAVATAIYAVVAGLLLLRLLIGIHLTWRLARAAKPMRETRGTESDVRISHDVAGPVTFGSTILLPSQWIDWDLRKREAVLAHEGAHVANRDFYILLLASLNRAVFWFSPFAWWQIARLAELAEIISDARAIEVLDDRLSYAEVLLDLVQSGRPRLAGLEMARASTVHARVERILTAAAMPSRAGWRKRTAIVAALVPVVVVSSGTIAYRSAPAAIDAGGQEQSAATVPWLQDVDFYAVNSRSVLAIFRQGNEFSAQITGQRKLRLSLAADRTYSYPAPGGLITFSLNGAPPAELTLNQNGRDLRALRIAARHRADAELNAMAADQYIGWYQLTPGRVLAVTRDGERMHVRETGRAKLEVKADGADAFSSAQDDLVVFIRDGQGKVTQALVEDTASGARLAPRIDADKARGIEEEFARRIAEVPDRFRDQAPAPGSKEAVLRGIADMQRGAPNYDRMSAGLAAKIRQQAPQLQAMLQSLGAVSSIFFRGVGPGGYDIYGVKFANGSADLRMLLGANGKVEDVLFHPSGNGEPGRFAACSDEPHLKLAGNGAPITIILYNNSGDDIQLYSLDANGSRTARGTLSDSMTSTFLTTVDSPWVVTDRAGQCLEIMLPGLQTRYHMVERAGGAPEYARRITPLSGSEEMLRQYIEGIARGQPIYDRMTAQLAAHTRQQLPFDRAILGRLGALRALTFRGVTALGTDIYVGHFANGSAEWRIGLARDGSIGRIVLGPQY